MYKRQYFYPRPPCGGRLGADRGRKAAEIFLSTPSVWRATLSFWCMTTTGKQFLSTPSVWRATGAAVTGPASAANFYPRPPCGGRQAKADHPDLYTDFYPRPPCGGRRVGQVLIGRDSRQFLSTPSVWRATQAGIGALPIQEVFLSTPSVWRATGILP